MRPLRAIPVLAALALVIAGGGAVAQGEVRSRTLARAVVDPMEDVVGWHAGRGNGAVSAALTSIAGCEGRALALDYDLGPVKGAWAQLRRDFDPPLDLSAFDHLRILHTGTAANTLEVGIVSESGRAYFAGSWPRATHAGRCTYATWDIKDFRSEGQPFPDPGRVRAIFVSVANGEGGDGGMGSLLVDEVQALGLRSRPVPPDETVGPDRTVAARAAAWIAARQQPAGLLKSWQEEPGDPAWLYDQALGLLVLAEADPPRAALLAEVLRGVQNPDGSWYAGYHAQPPGGPLGIQKPVGAVAWAAYALARYGAKTGGGPTSQAARRAGAWLVSLQRPDGSMPALPGESGAPTEPNLDAWWAFRWAGLKARADRLRSFLLGRVWDGTMGRFRSSPDSHRIFLDNQTFGAAFLRANGRSADARRALAYARATLSAASAGGSGLDGAGPFGVWNEGSLQYVSQRGEGSRSYWAAAVAQEAPGGGLPGSPDSFSGYVVWLTRWHGVAPTAWLYLAATGGPFRLP